MINEDLLQFISRCVSPFHVAESVTALLTGHGFQPLSETEPWALEPGKSYYVTRNGTSVIAFRMPVGPWRGFLMSAAHGDSPVFRLKENPETEKAGAYVCANVEKYGGMLLAPWFDRPLSVAGRVMIRKASGAEAALVNIDRDLMVIPSLAIHVNRTANENASYNPQTDMQPLLGSEIARGKLYSLIAEALKVRPEEILSSDLFLYLRQPGTVLGADREYICAPRLDDLMCAYTTVRGLLAAGNGTMIPLCCVMDNEEVGSTTRQGAASTFLKDVLARITAASRADAEALPRVLSASFMVSADNAHAIHPNHPEKYDPDNCCRMNKGVVIKYAANQKYATDAYSAAVFRTICEKAGVPFQSFANRADSPGGSTLGNISAGRVSVPTVDVGLPQLAMHSCWETAGAADADYMVTAMTAYFSADYRGDGTSFSLA
ncbi:MAG: M18 family aminopeptidase [Oscillospiraceae bacterium]|nr:M18 family aminopeptidase [Oscillospiraceae bacterium]